MFLRGVPKKGTVTNVRGSDAKKIRSHLLNDYNFVDAAALDQLWPSAARVTVQKLDTKAHCSLYMVDGLPLVLSYSPAPDARDDSSKPRTHLLPTLLLLRCIPSMMPGVVVNKGVPKFLLGGADLFMPGVVRIVDAVTDDQTEAGEENPGHREDTSTEGSHSDTSEASSVATGQSTTTTDAAETKRENDDDISQTARAIHDVRRVVVSHRSAADLHARGWVQRNFGPFQRGDIVALFELGKWAPVAVGEWLVSYDDLEYRGMQGAGIKPLLLVGDELWKEGLQTARSHPLHHRFMGVGDMPQGAMAAISEHFEALELQRQQLEHQRAEQEAQRQKEEELAFIEDAPRLLKRKEKVLRQTLELRKRVTAGEVFPDPDQRDKLDRQEELEQEIADIKERMTAAAPDSWEDRAGEHEGEWLEVDGHAAGNSSEVDAGQSSSAPTDSSTSGERGGDGGNVGSNDEDEDEETAEPAVDATQLVLDALMFVLHRRLNNQDLPMLAASFNAQLLGPTISQLAAAHGASNVGLKQSKWKKLGGLLTAMASEGVLSLSEPKKGVQQISAVDRTHSLYLDHDPDAVQALLSQVDQGDPSHASATSQSAQSAPRKCTLPSKGSVHVELKTVRGNKSITVVSGLQKFGIELSDELRKDMRRHFSAAVSVRASKNAKQGDELVIQGKYVLQVANFLKNRYGIPDKRVQAQTTGTSKKDRAVNL